MVKEKFVNALIIVAEIAGWPFRVWIAAVAFTISMLMRPRDFEENLREAKEIYHG